MNDEIASFRNIPELRALRERGFAIAVFGPGELAGLTRDDVEDVMYAAGTFAIKARGFDNNNEEG